MAEIAPIARGLSAARNLVTAAAGDIPPLDLSAIFPAIAPGSKWSIVSDDTASFIHNSDHVRQVTHGITDTVNGIGGSANVTNITAADVHVESDASKKILFKSFGVHMSTDIAATGADQVRITAQIDGAAPEIDDLAVVQARLGYLELRSLIDGSTSTMTMSPKGDRLVLNGSIPSDHSTFQLTLQRA